MRYQYRSGSRFTVNAQVVGERLEELGAIQGHITPAIVVDDARPEESPLHEVFEWDDQIAAERHREDEARRLIRSVCPVHVDAQGNETPVLGYVHVQLPDEGPCYVTTARAVSDDELREQVEREAIAAFEALRRRYEHILALRSVFQEIERAAHRAKKPRNARADARA